MTNRLMLNMICFLIHISLWLSYKEGPFSLFLLSSHQSMQVWNELLFFSSLSAAPHSLFSAHPSYHTSIQSAVDLTHVLYTNISSRHSYSHGCVWIFKSKMALWLTYFNRVLTVKKNTIATCTWYNDHSFDCCFISGMNASFKRILFWSWFAASYSNIRLLNAANVVGGNWDLSNCGHRAIHSSSFLLRWDQQKSRFRVICGLTDSLLVLRRKGESRKRDMQSVWIMGAEIISMNHPSLLLTCYFCSEAYPCIVWALIRSPLCLILDFLAERKVTVKKTNCAPLISLIANSLS